jgi:ABC-type dipeptide/oligopeptide/nickel transport system permease subunit
VSLTVAILAALASGVAGVTIGLVGGYFRGVVELLTVRLTDSRRSCSRCSSSPCSAPAPPR